MIGCLGNNLMGIDHAVRHLNNHMALPLVADCRGLRIYDSRFGCGRFWRLFYQISGWIAPCKNLGLQKLKNAIIHTQALFKENIPYIKIHFEYYKMHLAQSAKGYEVDKDSILPSQRILAKWNFFTLPFLKSMRRCSSHPELINLFEYSFGIENKPSALFNLPFVAELSACQKISDLECAVEGGLPLAIFRKVMKTKPITSIELKSLDRWIKKINKSNIPLPTLDASLKAISILTFKNSSRDFQKFHKLRLEMFLEDRGCALFQCAEKDYLLFQKQLKRGAKIHIAGEDFILSTEIPSRSPEKDHYRVFTLENNFNKVAVIAYNRVMLAIRNLRQKSKNIAGIESVQFDSISANGRLALMDRLQPLNVRIWKLPLDKDDEILLAKVGQFLKILVIQNFTPLNFNCSEILYDSQKNLIALKPMSKNSFDFNALEDFIFHFAAGNLTIYQHLMNLSGLSKHTVKKFYNEVIASTLEGDTIALDDLAGIYKISDFKVVDRAITLSKNLQEMKQRLYLQLIALHPDQNPLILQKAIQKSILEACTLFQTAGILWSSLENKVRNCIKERISSYIN